MQVAKINENKITPIKNVLLGSDPEFFALDSNNKPASLVGLIGGTKKRPIWLRDMLGYQEDNVAAEFNIVPSSDVNVFYESFLEVFNYIQKEKLDNHKYKFCFDSALYFDESQLKTKKAQEFGCEPDFNSWTLDENVSPAPGGNLRSAGGHLAVGYDNPNEDTNLAILRGLDLYLGVPSVMLDEGYLRKQMYGKAGAYRFKNFGLEYRTLSNFWFKDINICNYIFEQTFKLIDDINHGFRFDNLSDIEACIKAIDTNDRDIATYLLDKYKLETTVKELVKINV